MGNIGSVTSDGIKVSSRRYYDVMDMTIALKAYDKQFALIFGTVSGYDTISDLFVNDSNHTIFYGENASITIHIDDVFELSLTQPDWMGVTWEESESISKEYQHLMNDVKLHKKISRRPKDGEMIKTPLCVIVSLTD